MKRKDRNKKIWDHLYSMGKDIKEKRDQMHLEHKMEEEDNSLKDCTFKPNIKKAQSQKNAFQTKQEGSIYERQQLWKDHIQKTYNIHTN